MIEKHNGETGSKGAIYERVEEMARERKQNLREMDVGEKLALWEEAKGA